MLPTTFVTPDRREPVEHAEHRRDECPSSIADSRARVTKREVEDLARPMDRDQGWRDRRCTRRGCGCATRRCRAGTLQPGGPSARLASDPVERSSTTSTVSALGDQAIDEVRADEPGPADDEHAAVAALARRRPRSASPGAPSVGGGDSGHRGAAHGTGIMPVGDPTDACERPRASGPTVPATIESSTTAPAPIRPPGSTTDPLSRAPRSTTAARPTTLSAISAPGMRSRHPPPGRRRPRCGAR